MKSKILSFKVVESEQSGETMYHELCSLIKDWCIEQKIFPFTLDRAISNDKMVDYLRGTLNHSSFLLARGQYFHVKCAAHVLNSMASDGFKVIENIVTKIRESVRYEAEARKIKFRKAVKLAGIQVTKLLWSYVPSMWESTYMMIDRAILYRDAFTQLKLIDSHYTYCPEYHEWEMAENVRGVLEPINAISELFSGSVYLTSSLYFEHMWRISMVLKEFVQSPDYVMREMAIDMQKEFDKYWDSTEDDDYMTLFAFAMILDPRSKLSFVQFCYMKLFNDERKALSKVNYLQLNLGSLLICLRSIHHIKTLHLERQLC